MKRHSPAVRAVIETLEPRQFLSATPTLAASTAYVASLYQNLLGRAPVGSESQPWINALQAGQPDARIVTGITTTAEYRDHVVGIYYNLYLNRAPDAAGLAYWTGQLAAGHDLQSVQVGLLTSPEFYADQANTYLMDSAQYSVIKGLYTIVLGREPDAVANSYMANLMAGSAADQVKAVTIILTSDEYRGAEITYLYNQYLTRTPSAGDMAYWNGQFTTGLTEQGFVNAVADSAEFYTDATRVMTPAIT